MTIAILVQVDLIRISLLMHIAAKMQIQTALYSPTKMFKIA